MKTPEPPLAVTVHEDDNNDDNVDRSLTVRYITVELARY